MLFKRVWGGASLKTHLRFCESAVKSIQWANEPHTSPSFPFRGSWNVQNMCLCFKNRLIYIRGSCMVDWVSLTAQALPDSGTCCVHAEGRVRAQLTCPNLRPASLQQLRNAIALYKKKTV